MFYGKYCTKPLPLLNPSRMSAEELAGVASDALRKLGARLEARNRTIAWYPLWQLLRLAKRRRDVLGISRLLLFLADNTPPSTDETGQDNFEITIQIETLLGVFMHMEVYPKQTEKPLGMIKGIEKLSPPRQAYTTKRRGKPHE